MLGVYGNKIEATPAGRSLTSAAPTGADLARIEARRCELVAATQATDPKLIVPRIARLFLRFPSAKIEDPAGTTAAYAMDLASFPLWAIEAGIIALLKGHGLESKSFAPSSIIVREAVVREVAQVDAELAMISRVLSAKPKPEVTKDPARRAAALSAANAFVSGHRMAVSSTSRGGMTPDEIAEAQALSAAIATNSQDPRPMPPMGQALRRSLEERGAIRQPSPEVSDRCDDQSEVA